MVYHLMQNNEFFSVGLIENTLQIDSFVMTVYVRKKINMRFNYESSIFTVELL